MSPIQAARDPAPTAAPGGVAGLIVDAPDVLYDATLWRRRLLNLVKRMGLADCDASFLATWDCDYAADVHCGRRDYAEAFQSFLLSAGLTWAQVDEVEAASRAQRESFEHQVRPLPGVVATMAELSRLGTRLVAWADIPQSSARLAECLDRLDVGRRFAGVLTSLDVEAAQPSPECYRAALKLLGMPIEAVAYLGHDALHLAAAKDFGLRTIAFNYEPQAKADALLTRFEDLASLIQACPHAAASPVAAPTAGFHAVSGSISRGGCA